VFVRISSPSLKLPSSYRRFNIRMYRGVATFLVALAAFDYFYLDGKHRQHALRAASARCGDDMAAILRE
jgi:hypothetical protein